MRRVKCKSRWPTRWREMFQSGVFDEMKKELKTKSVRGRERESRTHTFCP